MMAEIDWDRYETYHTTGDTFEKQDIPYAMEMLKAAAAADPVTGRSCAETLELTDRILRDSLKVRSAR
jgi:hypothetical protein